VANTEARRIVWGGVLAALLVVAGVIVGAYASTHSLREWDWTAIPLIFSYGVVFLAVISTLGLALGWPFPGVGEDRKDAPVPPPSPEEQAPWIVYSESNLSFASEDRSARYRLVNTRTTPKYHASVTGTAMPSEPLKKWKIIPGNVSEHFDVPGGKDADQEFVVRWHLAKNKGDRVLMLQEKARFPYKT
jgi:hypothetical protein